MRSLALASCFCFGLFVTAGCGGGGGDTTINAAPSAETPASPDMSNEEYQKKMEESMKGQGK